MTLMLGRQIAPIGYKVMTKEFAAGRSDVVSTFLTLSIVKLYGQSEISI